MNGIAILAPIIIALLYGENQALTALVLSAFASFFVGFFFTNFSTEGEMQFESICTLMIATFFVLATIGSIPYVYLGKTIFGDMSFDKIFINSFFESMSGFSTTGMTILVDVEILPKSIIFFRGLSQWIGGVGIVYLMVLFLGSPSESTRVVGELSGFGKIKSSFRGTFWRIITIYLVYTVIFTILLVSLGKIDLFTSINLVFTGISTAGFLPINDLETIMTPVSMGIITVMMIFGATSFSVHNNLWGRELKKIFSVEYRFYILYIIIMVSTLGVIFSSSRKTLIDITFHIISAITTTGFQFIDIGTTSTTLKSVMVLLMIVGGSSFSTSGGIKIIRFIITLKSIPWVTRKLSLPAKAITPLKIGDKALFEKDVIIAFLMIGLGILSIFISSLIFTLYGYSFIDSIFEISSAFGTAGMSTGITGMNLPDPLKLILNLEMVIGRVEIIPFLIFLKKIINR